MFSKLVGNEHVKNVLRNFIRRSRVPNSLLFAGEEGVGKKQFAFELARTLVCTEPVDGEACDVCPACRRASQFTMPKPDDRDAHRRVIFSDHPDVGLVVPYNRYILVDAIRHLETEANFRPYEAASRVFIIDNADQMNDAAANALLKTLEEPPQESHIILATSRPDSLLPTIRSRCQTLRFAPVSSQEIHDLLVDKLAFTTDEARVASRLSRGSIGRAVNMKVDEMRGRRQRMVDVIRAALVTGDRPAMLRIAEQMNDAKNKDSFEDSIDMLASLLHDVWTIRASGDASRIANTDLADEFAGLARSPAAANIPEWLKAIETMRKNFAVNINRKVAADALFVGMTA